MTVNETRPRPKPFWKVVRYCADCVGLLVCWALWIALGALLAIQTGIAVSKEFAVPDFVLRSIEERFTASNVNARFGRATFDPTGGVLLENLSLSLPAFIEPVVNARAVLVQLDPWLLLAGNLEVRRIRATGITLSVPAMLARSGRSEDVLSELDFTITPGLKQLNVENLTARIAGIELDLHGVFALIAERSAGPIAPLPLIANLAENYGYFCRQLIRVAEELSAFEEPQLHATLTPSPDHGAIAEAVLIARGVKFPRFQAFEAHELSATISIPLLGDTAAVSPLTFTASELRTANGLVVRDFESHVQGLLNPAHFSFVPQQLQFTANDLRARGFVLQSISSLVQFSMPSTWSGDIIASVAGSPLALTGDADLTEKTAEFWVRGAFAPALLDSIGAQLNRDVRRFIDFGEPVQLDLAVTFQPGWKFAGLAGHIAARQIDAYRVSMDSASGHIEFDGRHFRAHDAVAALGENIAFGSFTQDLSTKEFRFLLEGNLRPLDIRGWFGPWWPGFFQHFEFPVTPPHASVDVAGRWFSGHETTVFVFADSVSPTIRGTQLDHGRTLMFIRPHFFDGLELFGKRGAGEVRGTFTRNMDAESREWRDMTFRLDSTLDMETGAGLLGPQLATRLSPFTFETAPQVKAAGRLDGPAAPGGEHQSVQIEARSTGAFSVFDFPARDVSFNANVRDNELTLDGIDARVAGGKLTGTARLTGPDAGQKLSFNANFRDGLLSEAVTLVSEYSARRRGESQGAGANLLPGKNQVKMNLDLAAEGNFTDLLSYHGNGNMQLSGAGLGEVRLLGLLSELLDFTALRFTAAQLSFQLNGSDVVFPSLVVTGPNSAIEGHGDYSLARGEMDFNARVYPFQESKSLLQNMVGVMLMPLSTMLEVKLTGPLKQPRWAFVMGPTNFFRSLTQTQPAKTEDPGRESDAPSNYLKR